MRLPCAVCLLAAVMSAQSSPAQEFRVANEIFKEGQKAPILRSLTLFKEDLIYDFAFAAAEGDDIEQATLYDFARNRFLIVDYRHNVKIEISQENLLRCIAEIAKLEPRDPLLKEAANPAFKVTREENTLKFDGARIKYEVKGFEPNQKSAAGEYQRFADWSARLSTLQGNQPPMARIAVNKELAQAGLIPKEVILLKTPSPIWESVNKLSSQHIVDWQLTKTDAKRIETLDAKMAQMDAITWAKYRERLATKRDDSKKR